MKTILNLLFILIFSISCADNSSSLKIKDLHRGKMGKWEWENRDKIQKVDTISKQYIPLVPFRFNATLTAIQLKYDKILNTWVALPLNSLDSSYKSISPSNLNKIDYKNLLITIRFNGTYVEILNLELK